MARERSARGDERRGQTRIVRGSRRIDQRAEREAERERERREESPEGPLVAQLSHLPIGPSHVLICLLVNPASLLSFISFLPFVEPSAPPSPPVALLYPIAVLAFFFPPRPSLVLEIAAPIALTRVRSPLQRLLDLLEHGRSTMELSVRRGTCR